LHEQEQKDIQWNIFLKLYSYIKLSSSCKGRWAKHSVSSYILTSFFKVIVIFLQRQSSGTPFLKKWLIIFLINQFSANMRIKQKNSYVYCKSKSTDSTHFSPERVKTTRTNRLQFRLHLFWSKLKDYYNITVNTYGIDYTNLHMKIIRKDVTHAICPVILHF